MRATVSMHPAGQVPTHRPQHTWWTKASAMVLAFACRGGHTFAGCCLWCQAYRAAAIRSKNARAAGASRAQSCHLHSTETPPW